MNTPANWTVDEVLEWLGDRFSNRDAALRAIELAAEGGGVVATARDNDAGGRRAEIDCDEWTDLKLHFSDVHDYWLLAPAGWRPWSHAISDNEGMFLGGPTHLDFQHDPRFAEPRWHDIRFRAKTVREQWAPQQGSLNSVVTKGADIKRATQVLAAELKDKGEQLSKADAEIIRTQFKISKKQFQTRVWPDAREAADLPRLAPAGAKRRAKR